jgi:thymidylate synthase
VKEIFVSARTLPEAYHNAIAALHDEGLILTANDWDQSQKEVSMTFVAREPLCEPMISKLYIGGFREMQQYVMEILDGILDFKIGDGWDYTYHDRMVNFPLTGDPDTGQESFDQVNFVINELKRQPDSRRAVMSIRDNNVDPFSGDPACLQHVQYFIRDGALHCKVLMRSNDAPKASFMNAFAFVMLQKKIADALGAPVGSYTHRANSYHAYSRDFSMLEQYAQAIANKPIDEITYEYEDFFKELMEESVPAIQAQVAELINKTHE